MDPPFQSSNVGFAYQLHYHIGFCTKRRLRIFTSRDRLDTTRQILADVCERSGYRILDLEIDERWVRLLLSLRPHHAPVRTVQTIKANTSRLLLRTCPDVEQEIGSRPLWSRGYYVRGVGDVTNEMVQQYLDKQRHHHEVDLQNARLLAEYQHPDRMKFFDLRAFAHCMAEYNCHLVCCPVRHAGAIDGRIAQPLLGYVLRIARVRQFEVIRLAVLSDHLHLFATMNPQHSPEHLALAVMNNTTHWLTQHNPGVFKAWDVPGFWTSSAFVRTAGAASGANSPP